MDDRAELIETIAKLRKDVDTLTGLVIGLVSAAEMRTKVAVRNYQASGPEAGPVVAAIAMTEMSMQQGQLLRLQNQDHSELSGDLLNGYNALIGRLSDAIGPYAMPVAERRAAA